MAAVRHAAAEATREAAGESDTAGVERWIDGASGWNGGAGTEMGLPCARIGSADWKFAAASDRLAGADGWRCAVMTQSDPAGAGNWMDEAMFAGRAALGPDGKGGAVGRNGWQGGRTGRETTTIGGVRSTAMESRNFTAVEEGY